MKEIDPKETSRACAFDLWMNAPMPMVTFFKTLNVGSVCKLGDLTILCIKFSHSEEEESDIVIIIKSIN